MNFHRISRHFPELRSLSPEQREAILRQADKALAQEPRPLARVRDKLLNLTLILSASLVLIKLVAPALALPQELTALIVMLILLPLYFLLQQRLYISKLRREIHKLLP
jgi:hypothetical protein